MPCVSRHRSAIFALSVLALICFNSSLLRAESEEPVHVIFQAPASCPGRDEFLSQLRARTARVVLAAPDAAAFSVDVTIHVEKDQFVGQLTLGAGSVAPAQRQFTAKSCETVVASLALAVALALDPEAQIGEVPAGEPPAGPSQPGDNKP